jgi:acyl carrier protein
MMFNIGRQLTRSQLYAPKIVMMASVRGYYKDNVLMPREKGEYYADPLMVAERVVRLFALHDNVRDPANVTLASNFNELGLNALDMCEIFIGIEREFDLEISEEDCEEMSTIQELVDFLSKHPSTK